MGPDRTAVARKRTTRRPVARPPRGGKRHPVEVAYGGSLARPARALRSLANLLRSLLLLAQGRHLGPATSRCPNQERRGRRGRVAGQRRQRHRPGAPACRGCPTKAEQARRKQGVSYPEDEALARSRGGLTTKLHLACDGRGRPLSVVLTPGQRHDSTQLEAVLESIRVPREGVGRP